MKTWMSVLALIAALILPSQAAAQICAGTPLIDGQNAFAGRAIFFDGGQQFGGMGAFNVDGPLSFEVNADLVDSDVEDADLGFEIAGRGFYALPNLEIPICPMAGLSYTTIEELDILGIQAGVALGADVALNPGTDLIFHGIPTLVLSRASVDDESDTETDFQLELGGTVAGERVFGSLLVYVADDTAFGFRIGIVR